MSNLIITLIAIALSSVIILASIYNGGSALNQGASRAAGSALLNQGLQITGAANIYSNENNGAAPVLTDLTAGNYLKSTPAGAAPYLAWSLSSDEADIFYDATSGTATAQKTASAKAICETVERQRTGASGAITIATIQPTGANFGCYGTDASGYHVFYKV